MTPLPSDLISREQAAQVAEQHALAWHHTARAFAADGDTVTAGRNLSQESACQKVAAAIRALPVSPPAKAALAWWRIPEHGLPESAFGNDRPPGEGWQPLYSSPPAKVTVTEEMVQAAITEGNYIFDSLTGKG